MLSYHDRIKMSIMTTRSKANKTPIIGTSMDIEPARSTYSYSGFNQNRNAYNVKKQLLTAKNGAL